MKWPIASASLLLLTLLVLAAGFLNHPAVRPDALFSEAFTGEDVQLGYYDLLAHQREVYDIRFDSHAENLLMTLTSPNDNRFMAKASLEQPQGDGNGVTWRYRQLHYAGGDDARLIKNILGNAAQNGVRFDLLQEGSQPLAIAPSGQILLLR